MKKTYILKNNEIVEMCIASVMQTHEGELFYHLVSSEDSLVDKIRPVMTPTINTFTSPQAIANKLMEKWHEDMVEHEGQKKFQFDGDTDSITYPPEEAYPTEEIRTGTMRQDTESGHKEIYNGFNWIPIESLQGDILYRKYYTEQKGLDPKAQAGISR